MFDLVLLYKSYEICLATKIIYKNKTHVYGKNYNDIYYIRSIKADLYKHMRYII